MILNKIKQAIARKKCLSEVVESDTNLKRCLSTVDLILLGIATLGAGVYIVAGQVVRLAGPAAVVSYIIATVAALLSALSYAEFGGRISKAGSAYIYSYVLLGELWAFLIGWCIIQEYILGAASTASGLSVYTDNLTNNTISNFFIYYIPLPFQSLLAPCPDFLSFLVVLILTVTLCFGINEPTRINNLLVVYGLFSFVFILISGSFFLNFHNWNLNATSIGMNNGVGGLMPYGVAGVLKGAGIAFFSFVGFDLITIAGEETKEPVKSVPRAVLASILICSIFYIFLVSLVSLAQPYYMVSNNAVFSEVFNSVGQPIIATFVGISAIISNLSSLMANLIALSRMMYAMSSDGLLCGMLSRISQTFKSPIYATLLSGLVSGIISLFVKLSELVSMLSIGTLFVYTVVNYCVLLLRYQESSETLVENSIELEINSKSDIKLLRINGKETNGKSYGTKIDDEGVKDTITQKYDKNKENIIPSIEVDNENIENMGNEEIIKDKIQNSKLSCREILFPKSKEPTKRTKNIFIVCTISIVITTMCGTLLALFLENYLGNWGVIGVLVGSKVITIFFIVIIQQQPQKCPESTFKVPLVPYIPMIGIVINIHLMIYMSWEKWLRIIIWTLIGVVSYFLYGVHNSHLNNNKKKVDYANLDEEDSD